MATDLLDAIIEAEDEALKVTRLAAEALEADPERLARLMTRHRDFPELVDLLERRFPDDRPRAWRIGRHCCWCHDGLSYAEVAARSGHSPATVRRDLLAAAEAVKMGHA